MTLAANVLEITGATFGATDTFVIFTNISRDGAIQTAVEAIETDT